MTLGTTTSSDRAQPLDDLVALRRAAPYAHSRRRESDRLPRNLAPAPAMPSSFAAASSNRRLKNMRPCRCPVRCAEGRSRGLSRREVSKCSIATSGLPANTPEKPAPMPAEGEARVERQSAVDQARSRRRCPRRSTPSTNAATARTSGSSGAPCSARRARSMPSLRLVSASSAQSLAAKPMIGSVRPGRVRGRTADRARSPARASRGHEGVRSFSQ